MKQHENKIETTKKKNRPDYKKAIKHIKGLTVDISACVAAVRTEHNSVSASFCLLT